MITILKSYNMNNVTFVYRYYTIKLLFFSLIDYELCNVNCIVFIGTMVPACLFKYTFLYRYVPVLGTSNQTVF